MAEQIQIELDASKALALDALAARSGKRREDLVAQAVDDLLELEQYNLNAIREGLDDASAGRITPHEEIVPLIQSLRKHA